MRHHSPCPFPMRNGAFPNSTSCSTKFQLPISALCYENTSAFRFKTALNDSKSPSPIFPLKCSLSGKTDLLESDSHDEGNSGKFEQLEKPSSVSDFIENSFLIDLNSSILQNQVSFHAGSKPWCPVCSTTHWLTARFVLLKNSGLKSPNFDYLGWVPDKPVYYHLTNLSFSS